MVRKAFGWLLLLISWPMFYVAFVCFLLLIFDCVISPVMFLWSGDLTSIWNPAIAESWEMFGELETPLKGFDLLINQCWHMQLDFYGRLKLIAIGVFIGVPVAILGLIASSLEAYDANMIFGLPGMFLAWPVEIAWCLGILNLFFDLY